MRTPLFALGVAVTMACGGVDGSSDPLAPSAENLSTGGDGAATAKKEAVELPFRGSFAGFSSSTEVVPPSHTVSGTAEGTATHLGRFTARSVDVVLLATGSATGTWNFTAANGDQLFTTTAGAPGCVHPAEYLARHTGCNNRGWDWSIRRSHWNLHAGADQYH